ncbi:hypothetical protein RclHR1_11810006 [Rhizophagus clarus]|uniref:Uncharacterized protein n=1 Tax=Rhizophagus clarus TaxID=94130 RepID=A0A2Z6QX36_9GLOM|nr:hypothetical protein RclHR1_11810006 [Rhizophagus clarus]
MYQRHIIYVSAIELDFIDISVINQELYDIPIIFTVSEFLPDFLNKLEEKRFGSWKELATWARSSFEEFANRVWPTKSQDEDILVNYIQDIMIHYGEYFDEPCQKNLLEGDVNCCHIIPLTKILRKYCLVVSGERFSVTVQFRNKFSKSSNGRGSKTDMGGDIAGIIINQEFITFQQYSQYQNSYQISLINWRKSDLEVGKSWRHGQVHHLQTEYDRLNHKMKSF